MRTLSLLALSPSPHPPPPLSLSPCSKHAFTRFGLFFAFSTSPVFPCPPSLFLLLYKYAAEAPYTYLTRKEKNMLARASTAVQRQQKQQLQRLLLLLVPAARARTCCRGLVASSVHCRSITSSSPSLSSTLHRSTHGFSSSVLLSRVLPLQATTEICGGQHPQLRFFSKKSKKGRGNESEGAAGEGEGEDVFDWDPDEVSLEMEEAIERLQRRLGRIRSGHNPVDSFNAVWLRICS